MIPSPLDVTITDSADLLRLWECLMGPWGFSSRTLWLIFLDDDGFPLPLIAPIEDMPAEPDERSIAALRMIVSDLLSDHRVASVPMLLSRPGSARMQPADRRWARALSGGLGRGLASWPIHLATKGSVRAFAPDDLIAA